MKKSISVNIKGNKNPIHNCLDCNNQLTEYEYNKADNLCTSCRSKYYSGEISQYIDIYGNNKVDEILKNKIGRR